MQEPSLALVRAFVTVARHQSFARAARELGMTPSSVSRLVKQLEAALGIVLINRTTRAMSLTEAGQRYYADCAAGFEQLRGAWERLRDEHELPQGTLRLSAPLVFGRSHVVPHLSGFMRAYPQIEIDLIMTDRYVDIVGEGVTLAIRIGRLEDSTLIAKKLLPNRRILVAAPGYLQRHGEPASVDDLARHDCLVSTASHDGEAWRLFGPEGERLVRPRPRARADNGDAVRQLAVDGHGIAFHSAVTMAPSMRAGELVQVLPAWAGRETGVYAVYPARALGPVARSFLDYLAARWAEDGTA
ncbi:LysR family transcriptional regulator [Massilia solisilvae]|uniref:LysR family transcriptional regulator n=1 Tax=Massilia solisilvae TaxID=1811225 RepID=A0ABT2BP66_9BURK|nr:LysR family transcriptional regulator [Massilia solisilvae]MCS0610302.1 LysR family transcriptional regulator [Massilia solisilvae]